MGAPNPQYTSGDRPNILFLFTDQQRPDYGGWNEDNPTRTPNLEALAERGRRLSNAVCPSPVCNPCRASIASGYEYDRCGVPGNKFDYPLTRTTFYERLRDQAGYHVLGCGKWDLSTDFRLGLEGNQEVGRWGFSDGRFNPAKNNTVRRINKDASGDSRDPYTKYLAERDLLETHIDDIDRRWQDGLWTATYPTPLPDHAYYDNWITRTGLELLEEAPRNQPWFLEVNFQNPHHPWDVTKEMHGWYRDPDVEFPAPVNSDLDVSKKVHQEIRRNYAAMIEHLDNSVGRFLDKLEELDELENTIIVFTSDHGEMLGDYGQWQKLSPFQASVGVPFVVAGPSIADRPVSDAPATLLDLHATFLDYAGVPIPNDIDSRTMRPLLEGEAEQTRDVVYSGLSSWRMVYDGRYKLIKGYDPESRHASDFEAMAVALKHTERRLAERERILYDLEQNESDNVRDAHPDVAAQLDDRLETIRAGGR